MTNKKKSLNRMIALIALMLCCVLSVGAIDLNGQCGENVFYYIDVDKKEMKITGDGYIQDWWKVCSGDNYLLNVEYIESLIVENGVSALGNENTFSKCSELKKVVLSENINVLPAGCFSRCVKLKEINIPEECITIGRETFMSCTSLENIVIPENVTQIGMHAFWQCANLKIIVIESESLTIANYTFNGCSNLTDVYYSGTEEQWNKIEIGKYNDELLNATIHFNHKHIDLIVDGFCDDCTAKVGAAHTHTYTSSVTKAATCAADGIKIFTCSCGDTYTENIKATGKHTGGTATCKEKAKCSVCKQPYGNLKTHTYKTTTTKATLKKNGKTESKCTACGNVKSTTAINKVKTVKLSATEHTYTGKTITPSVTVKDSKGKTLKKGTDYTVSYPKKRKSVGKYTVTVTFKGNYSGSKKLSFEIVPAKATLSKLTPGSKQLTATWKTVSGVTGYEVAYSTSKKFTKKTTKTVTIKKAKTKKTTIKKLTKGKKYYVKVRAYKTVGKTKIYGAYSAVKNVKVK